jgi:hypothetical protein
MVYAEYMAKSGFNKADAEGLEGRFLPPVL